MKRFPFWRILFLFVTVAAFFAAPFILDYVSTHQYRPTASLPIVGQSFPIAGQDESEISGIVLRAQDEAEIGELVRIDASASDVDSLAWQIIPYTEDFEVIEDGRRAFFSSRVGGSYLIIIGAAKGNQAYLTHHTIEVIGEEPEPGPETLSIKVRRWTKSVEKYEMREGHALALAGVFRKLANAEDVDVENMLEATATANSAILGDDLDKWLPLLEPLGQELDTISAAGGLGTRDQYKDVWLAIAEGIEKGV